MLRPDVKEKIANFITDYFIKDSGISLTDDTLLLENKVIDSTGVIELVSFLESTFDITVEDEEIIPENLNSLNRITDFVRSKIPQKTTV
jgi:acyl carrier protein